MMTCEDKLRLVALLVGGLALSAVAAAGALVAMVGEGVVRGVRWMKQPGRGPDEGED